MLSQGVTLHQQIRIKFGVYNRLDMMNMMELDTNLILHLIMFFLFPIVSVLLIRPTWTHEQLLQNLIGVKLLESLHFIDSYLMTGLNVVCLVHGTTTMDMVCTSMRCNYQRACSSICLILLLL